MSARVSVARPAAEVVGAQLSGAVGLGLAWWLLTGRIGVFVPLAGVFLGGFALLWRRLGTDPTWLDRPRLRRVAVLSGLAHWLAGALAYSATYLADPVGYGFDAGALPLAALVLGLAPALAALGLTLCAADGLTPLLGPLDDGGEVRPPRAAPPTSSHRRARP